MKIPSEMPRRRSDRSVDYLRDEVIPTARKQMMKLSDSWEGTGSQAALDEASAIIDKHEANARAVDDTAGRLRNMEASVVKTKNAANKTPKMYSVTARI